MKLWGLSQKSWFYWPGISAKIEIWLNQKFGFFTKINFSHQTIVIKKKCIPLLFNAIVKIYNFLKSSLFGYDFWAKRTLSAWKRVRILWVCVICLHVWLALTLFQCVRVSKRSLLAYEMGMHRFYKIQYLKRYFHCDWSPTRFKTSIKSNV